MLTKTEKADIVKDLEAKLAAQRVVIFSDFHGLSVAKQQELRRLLKKDDAEFRVAKKTLFRRAFEIAKAPFSHIDYKGELGAIFGFGDEVGPAKLLAKFAKANPESLKIVGGLLGSRELSKAEVLVLAKLPSKQELVGQLVWVLASPLRGLANVLNGNQRKLVVALSQILKQKSS
ncbi:MAG: 50S ribosomal protein L10 [Candidatus Sungbacteria bacterium]|uniref:Large ribosomal subunit protein uL10 n=1 Tax=Candidatus Sungiibacteriota bacterium TaxID=2750080 RepID=A0A931WPG6_9BACT|nr:50S ribosomal protein L10 [Candidatus Sungbacteria bacterium]